MRNGAPPFIARRRSASIDVGKCRIETPIAWKHCRHASTRG